MKEYYWIILILIAWVIFRVFVWQRKNYHYRCPHCGAIFQLTNGAQYLGFNLLIRKYVRCPKCNRFGFASVVQK